MRYTRFYIGLVIFLILAFGLFFYLIFNDTYTEGVYQIGKENKIEEKGNLYLMLDDYKLAVPERYYDVIKWEENYEYHVRYVYKAFSKNNGDVVMLKKYGYSP